MRFFLLAFASILTMLNISPLKATTVDPDYCHENRIDYISIEPLKNSGMITNIIVKYSFDADSNGRASFIDVKIKNSSYPNGQRVKRLASTEKEKTITIEYDQRYSNLISENTFIFNLTGQGYDQVILEAKTYAPQVMRVTEENVTFESEDLISIYRRDSGKNYYKEKYVFSNMIQEIQLDHTAAVGFAGLTFNYIAPERFPLNYDNARVVIEAPEGTLNNFGTQLSVGNWRRLDMTIIQNENTGQYVIKPIDDFYVNPYTLEMASFPIEGYIKTHYLFFPHPKSDLDTYVIRYMVDDMGANDNDLIYQFKVYVSKGLFGNCSDSYYCLTTEDAYPDLESGTVITN